MIRTSVPALHVPQPIKRATGIEPALEAWKASVQPKHFARAQRFYCTGRLEPLTQCVRPDERLEADEPAANGEERFVDVLAALVADSQPPVLV